MHSVTLCCTPKSVPQMKPTDINYWWLLCLLGSEIKSQFRICFKHRAMRAGAGWCWSLDLQCKHRQVTYEYTGLRRGNGYSQSCHCFWRTWVVCFPGTNTPEWEELFFLIMVVMFHYTGACDSTWQEGRVPLSLFIPPKYGLIWFALTPSSFTSCNCTPYHAPIAVFRWGFLCLKSSNLTMKVYLSILYATHFVSVHCVGLSCRGKKLQNRNQQLSYSIGSGEVRENWKAMDKLMHGIS